jgi:hypothetical protein
MIHRSIALGMPSYTANTKQLRRVMQDSSEHDRRVLSLNGQSAFPKFAFFS